MYRVLIVDDEPEIRMGHRLKVNWEELGLIVGGEASNGIEAMELLANEPYDIVMVDMNMPVMNGVSLLEACHERYPHMKLLIITGYEDFQYAKAALKNEARDYLLKPVARDELTDALQRIVHHLDEERRKQGERQIAEWRLTQFYKEMKEHFIVHLVKEQLERDRVIRDRAKLFELADWDGRRVSFVTAGLDERSEKSRQEAEKLIQMRLPFELICREFAQDYPQQPQPFRDLNYPGLMHFALLEEDDAASASFAAALRDCVRRQLHYDPVIGIGRPVTGFREWKGGYLSSLLSWSLAAGNVRSEAPDASEGRIALSDDAMKLLERLVERGEIAAFEETVRTELGRAFQESHSSFVKLIFQLFLQLDSWARRSGGTPDGFKHFWLRPDMVLSLDTVDKASGLLAQFAARIRQEGSAEADDIERSVIAEAQRYIQDNYMYDINLTTLADRYKYNSSYFSELFKSRVGKTFIQYLTDVRMAQALRLLEETTLNLWDIAELTGFSNASYFSSKFKKVYGISPSDYRAQASKKSDSELPKK